MELKDFIVDTLEQCRQRLHVAMSGLTEEELSWRPTPEANSIAFIMWHLTRVEDRWTQRFARDEEEVWLRDGWSGRFGIPEGDTGVGYTARKVARFPRLAGEDLESYLADVRKETLDLIAGLTESDWDDAPGRTPFPERPTAVKLFEGCTISRMFRQLIGEEYQHLGHVAFLRGLQKGLEG